MISLALGGAPARAWRLRSGRRFPGASLGWALPLAAALAIAGPVAAPRRARAAPRCPMSYGGADQYKSSWLYLYFPTGSDTTFPPAAVTDCPALTSAHAAPFDAGALTAALREAVHDVVADQYCELDVQVHAATTNPDTAAAAARRVVVAVGSDTDTSIDQWWGLSATPGVTRCGSDLNDEHPTGYGRVWAGYLGDSPSVDPAGWANAIGAVAAHEAGHTFGLFHECGCGSRDVCTGCPATCPCAGQQSQCEVDSSGNVLEDEYFHHLMGDGCLFASTGPGGTFEHQKAYRHFSDWSFSTLAANVGLSVQTLHNWDFVNPNGAAAAVLEMKVLSDPARPLVATWSYAGDRSPWINPEISDGWNTTATGLDGAVGQTESFPDPVTNVPRTWAVHTIRWRTPNPAWTHTAGQIAGCGPSTTVPCETFHVGAAFEGVSWAEVQPVIIRDVRLRGTDGTPDTFGTVLRLAPRLPGYDAATISPTSGVMAVRFFNPDPARPMKLVDIEVLELPRVLALDRMRDGEPLESWDRVAITPWRRRRLPDLEVRDTAALEIARLAAGRHIFTDGDKDRGTGFDPRGTRPGERQVPEQGAPRDRLVPERPLPERPPPDRPAGRGASGGFGPREVDERRTGVALDLFPATTVYLTATVLDGTEDTPAARRTRTRLYYQFAGVHPDLDHDRVDDAIDILRDPGRDRDRDGVIDRGAAPAAPALPTGGTGAPWPLLLAAAALLLLVIVLLVALRLRRSPRP